MPKFDPEGEGYDIDTAVAAGMKPDKTGHWQSRNPSTGQILKGRKHTTFNLTEEGEAKAGYEIYKGDDGKYYSRKKKQQFKDFKDLQEAGPEVIP